MGIYIKGMDMSEIEKLVFTDKVQLVFVWTSTPSILTAKTISETKDGVKIYSKEYEVVRVKEPHGDLIDREEVFKVIEHETLGSRWGEEIGTDEETYIGKFKTIDDIDMIPTVIESERT